MEAVSTSSNARRNQPDASLLEFKAAILVLVTHRYPTICNNPLIFMRTTINWMTVLQFQTSNPSRCISRKCHSHRIIQLRKCHLRLDPRLRLLQGLQTETTFLNPRIGQRTSWMSWSPLRAYLSCKWLLDLFRVKPIALMPIQIIKICQFLCFWRGYRTYQQCPTTLKWSTTMAQTWSKCTKITTS